MYVEHTSITKQVLTSVETVITRTICKVFFYTSNKTETRLL